MERKTFLKRLGGTLLIALPLMKLVGCSSSDDSGDNNNQGNERNCLDNGAMSGGITSNHGHILSIPKADIQAGVEKTYNIQGTSEHDHFITINSDDFLKLKNNEQVIVNSTNVANHSHTVTVICA
ncbi:MAG: hypothetical protein R2785_10310 [Flavobacteriaceae bacterium]